LKKRDNKKRKGEREYKDEGGEGGKKEGGGLRRRTDKKETQNGVNEGMNMKEGGQM
jgi:hypothetical protein